MVEGEKPGIDITKLSRRERKKLFEAVEKRGKLGKKYGTPGFEADAGKVQEVVDEIKKRR